MEQIFFLALAELLWLWFSFEITQILYFDGLCSLGYLLYFHLGLITCIEKDYPDLDWQWKPETELSHCQNFLLGIVPVCK